FWQFPARLATRDGYYPSSPSGLISRALPLRGIGAILAQEGYDNHLVGVSARDGRALWRKRLPGLRISDLAALDEGALILAYPIGKGSQQPTYPWLFYIDGLSGRLRRLTRLPLSHKLLMDGDTLFVLGSYRLYAYSRASILTGRF